MNVRLLFLAALVAAALPASASDKIRIANEGTIDGEWSLVPASQLMPPYPTAYANDPEQVCLVVGYLVNADGHTSDFSLLKSWTSGNNSRTRNDFWQEFADLSSRALAQWKYTPKAGAAKPVYTAATFVFGAPGEVAATRQHCEVSDLTTRLLELRYNDRAGRLMAHGIYSQLQIDPGVIERFRQAKVTKRENQAQATAAQIRAFERAPPQQPPPPPPSGKN